VGSRHNACNKNQGLRPTGGINALAWRVGSRPKACNNNQGLRPGKWSQGLRTGKWSPGLRPEE
jgi:hypothetical protein